jgi:hypothetical protein
MARTFEVWKRHPVPFIVAAILLDAPSVAVSYLQGSAAGRQEALVSSSVVLIVSGLGTLILTGALTFGTLESLAGRPVRLAAMLTTGLRRSGRVLAVSFLTGIIIGVTFLLLVVPGLMSMSALWLAVPAAIGEPDADASPIERSRGLSKGHRWTLFFSLVLFLLLSFVAYFVLRFSNALVARGAGVGAAVALVFAVASSALASGLYATAPAVAFHDLRALKEGGDSSTLAKVFE